MQEQSKFTVKFLKYETQDQKTYFKISVTDINCRQTWFIMKRYSELLQVHEELVKSDIGSLPHFPKKKLFGNDDPVFLNKRQIDLDTYFNVLLNHKTLDTMPSLKAFLLQGKKQTSTKQNVQEQEEKLESQQLNGMQKKQGLEKYVNESVQKFIDLSENVQIPEYDEIQKKKEHYSKFQINKSKFLSDLLYPKKGKNNLETEYSNENIIIEMTSLNEILNQYTDSAQKIFIQGQFIHQTVI